MPIDMFWQPEFGVIGGGGGGLPGPPGPPGEGFKLDAENNYDMDGKKITNLAESDNPNDAATVSYVDRVGKVGPRGPRGVGFKITDGNYDMEQKKIVGLATPQEADINHAATVGYVNGKIASPFSGDMGGGIITNLGDSDVKENAANIKYVNEQVDKVGMSEYLVSENSKATISNRPLLLQDFNGANVKYILKNRKDLAPSLAITKEYFHDNVPFEKMENGAAYASHALRLKEIDDNHPDVDNFAVTKGYVDGKAVGGGGFQILPVDSGPPPINAYNVGGYILRGVLPPKGDTDVVTQQHLVEELSKREESVLFTAQFKEGQLETIHAKSRILVPSTPDKSEVNELVTNQYVQDNTPFLSRGEREVVDSFDCKEKRLRDVADAAFPKDAVNLDQLEASLKDVIKIEKKTQHDVERVIKAHGKRIISLADPDAGDDAATKTYVDNRSFQLEDPDVVRIPPLKRLKITYPQLERDDYDKYIEGEEVVTKDLLNKHLHLHSIHRHGRQRENKPEQKVLDAHGFTITNVGVPTEDGDAVNLSTLKEATLTLQEDAEHNNRPAFVAHKIVEKEGGGREVIRFPLTGIADGREEHDVATVGQLAAVKQATPFFREDVEHDNRLAFVAHTIVSETLDGKREITRFPLTAIANGEHDYDASTVGQLKQNTPFLQLDQSNRLAFVAQSLVSQTDEGKQKITRFPLSGIAYGEDDYDAINVAQFQNILSTIIITIPVVISEYGVFDQSKEDLMFYRGNDYYRLPSEVKGELISWRIEPTGLGELYINGIQPDGIKALQGRQGLRYVHSGDKFTVKKLYGGVTDVVRLELVIEMYSGLQQIGFHDRLRVLRNPWRLWNTRFAEGRTVNVAQGETNHRERTS